MGEESLLQAVQGNGQTPPKKEPEQPILPPAEPGPPPRSVGQGEEQVGGSVFAKGIQAHPGWMGMAKVLIRVSISSSGSLLGLD